MPTRRHDLQDEQRRACAEAAAVGERFHLTGDVAFVVNSDRAFITHRATWASALRGAGAHVTVFAPDTGYRGAITGLGFNFIEIDLGRENIGPLKAARAAIMLGVWVLRKRPAAVFLVQTAAYTLGWLAAPLAPRTRFVRVAGGIGRALSKDTGSGQSRLAKALIALGKWPRNVTTLFQIDSDRTHFVEQGLATTEKSRVVAGTGIDTSVWKPSNKPERSPDAPLIVGFASRLYAEKGVREFVAAASALHGPRARFVLVGEPDVGVSSSISEEEIAAWHDQGAIEYWGHRDDMLNVFQQFDLLVFPSRHPEGTPRTLIEAAACGVPAVVSDQSGCREVVIDRVTGWVLRNTSAEEVTAVVSVVLSELELLEEASAAARSRAVNKFGLEHVIHEVLDLAGSKQVDVSTPPCIAQSQTGSMEEE